MIKIKKGKLYLVTGGSGFLGFELVKRILSEGGRVRTLSRDEGKLIQLKQKYPDPSSARNLFLPTLLTTLLRSEAILSIPQF